MNYLDFPGLIAFYSIPSPSSMARLMLDRAIRMTHLAHAKPDALTKQQDGGVTCSYLAPHGPERNGIWIINLNWNDSDKML
jgi:hypothetical protein